MAILSFDLFRLLFNGNRLGRFLDSTTVKEVTEICIKEENLVKIDINDKILTF